MRAGLIDKNGSSRSSVGKNCLEGPELLAVTVGLCHTFKSLTPPVAIEKRDVRVGHYRWIERMVDRLFILGRPDVHGRSLAVGMNGSLWCAGCRELRRRVNRPPALNPTVFRRRAERQLPRFG